MGTDTTTRKAGAWADAQFRSRRRAWLKRVWWAFPLVAVFEVAVAVGGGLIVRPDDLSFFWGLGIGVAMAMTLILGDSPPHHIARWRQGAEGERATAKALRPLTRKGWVLLNDIDTGRGNIDHVLVGPGGVFLLETKNLSGVVAVERGVLSVRWREDPTDGYENRSLAWRARGASVALASALHEQDLRVWVQPVVVVWATFEQRSIESQGVAWVRGKDLANVLSRRPLKLSEVEVSRAVAVLRAALATGDHVLESRPAGVRPRPAAHPSAR